MKFDDLPVAYAERVEADTNCACERYIGTFIECYAEDRPDDTAIISDELVAFVRRWPGNDDPHYGISLIRNIQFDDDYWPRSFELTVRFELSLPNYWLPRHHSICSSPELRLDFHRAFRSTTAFRWYRKRQPGTVTIRAHGEEDMLSVFAAMAPFLCGTGENAEP